MALTAKDVHTLTEITQPAHDDELYLMNDPAVNQYHRRITVQNLRGAWVNVQGYGAVGDGITDDTTAIQTAIDVLKDGTGAANRPTNNAGGTIYFPKGIYLISAALKIYEGMTFQGDGQMATRIYNANVAGANAIEFTASGRQAAGNPEYSTVIRDLSIKGNASSGYGVYIQGFMGVYAQFQNVRVEYNGSGGVYYNVTVGGQWTECDIEYNYGWGVYVDDTVWSGSMSTTVLVFNNSRIRGNGLSGAAGVGGVYLGGPTGGATQCRFTGRCIIESNAGIGLWVDAVNNGFDNVYFENNDKHTGTDGVAVIGDQTFTSATTSWAATDLYKVIRIVGAGVAGATLTTYIAAYNSEHSIELAVAPSTAVDPATFYWGYVALKLTRYGNHFQDTQFDGYQMAWFTYNGTPQYGAYNIFERTRWSLASPNFRLENGANYNQILNNSPYSTLNLSDGSVGTFKNDRTLGAGPYAGPISTTNSIYAGTSIGAGTNTTPIAVLQGDGAMAAATTWQQGEIRSTDAFAINKGGTLGFGGKYNTAGAYTNFGGISARKEDAGDGTILGYLLLLVQGGSGLTEAARFDSAGALRMTGAMVPRVVTYAVSMNDSVAGVTGEMVFCSTDTKFYGCTAGGVAGAATWAAFH